MGAISCSDICLVTYFSHLVQLLSLVVHSLCSVIDLVWWLIQCDCH